MTRSVDLLLIDDNATDADVLRENLKEMHGLHCRMDWERDFESGLSRARENKHDVYFVDYYLGGRTGADLIREAIRGGCSRPLILCSGRADLGMGMEAVSQGAADYLVKDYIGPFLLEKTLLSVLERERILRENERMQLKAHESNRLESLGLMACGIAHDFNNILGIILANTELAMADLSQDSKPRANLDNVVKATMGAADLTAQMLAFAGRGHFKLARVDLAEIAAETVKLSRQAIPDRIRIEPDLQGPWPEILADAIQLRQVILNLLKNAADAIMGAGTIRLVGGFRRALQRDEGLQFTPPLDYGKYVSLTVEDSGGGMRPEVAARIFDPFFTTKSLGRGLGMASVLGIIKNHRGGIRVQSDPGHGTRITIIFPITHSEEPGRSAPLE